MTPVLLPLYVDPATDPASWQAAAAGGSALTVVVDALDHPTAVTRLRRSGVTVLGRVDTEYATRGVADLLDEVERWAGTPVTGIFLDQAPTSEFCLGLVALAIRVARRAELSTVVLNPGIPTDPRYRELGVPICTFEGSWPEYRRWEAEDSWPGDGHLVHSLPAEALPAAQQLLRQRCAGFGLLTDRAPPEPYGGVPGWWRRAVPSAR